MPFFFFLWDKEQLLTPKAQFKMGEMNGKGCYLKIIEKSFECSHVHHMPVDFAFTEIF